MHLATGSIVAVLLLLEKYSLLGETFHKFKNWEYLVLYLSLPTMENFGNSNGFDGPYINILYVLLCLPYHGRSEARMTPEI